LRAYAAPGAAPALIALQDEDGASVCLLLWAAWTAVMGRSPDADALAEAARLARDWETSVIGPLRAARRGLKRLADPAPEALRAQIHDVELAAERALLEALEAAGPCLPSPSADMAQILAAACEAWGAPARHQALAALAAAFPRA
jgi:uncharacterized protein (TIGR02444 family)